MLPNLTTQQLDYLRTAVASPTWADAANQLGVSPSALSQGLAELERRVGVTLFERDGRRRVPTADCNEVVAYAERVLADTADLATWAERRRSGRTGRLRVGMIDAAAVDHFGHALLMFRGEHPDVDLHLVVEPSAQLLVQVGRGDLDFVVCVAPITPPPGIDTVELLREPLAVYAPEGAARASQPSWGPWVTFPRGSHTRALIEERVTALGADFRVVAESHQPEVLREMVRLGLGWTVLPATQAERPPDPLPRARRRPLLHRSIVAARRANAVADPAAEVLLTLLRRTGTASGPS
jgi:DNA-binding transcriptional LysR family regulator